MNVLIVGSGGREHALAWKIAQSSLMPEIFCDPGNPGIAKLATCVPIKATEIAKLVEYAIDNEIDLVVVGPEVPLTMGIADEMHKAGIRVFGPTKAASAIEGSKIWAKELMAKYSIPTAGYRLFGDPSKAHSYVTSRDWEDGFKLVVKPDGLTAGKGVVVCDTLKEADNAIKTIMEEHAYPGAGNRIIIEDFLEGTEASMMAITDGITVVGLPAVRDYKRLLDGDRGPNTGSMGSDAPARAVTPQIYQCVMDTIIQPTIDALRREGCPYLGTIYAGLMLTKDGPMVVEFNCRFGDPETQVALPLLGCDLLGLILAAVGYWEKNTLADLKPDVKFNDGYAVCMVKASKGYPGKYETGKPITGLEQIADMKDVVAFHAGTKLDADGTIVTDGGRVVGITGYGKEGWKALDVCNRACRAVSFDGQIQRHDIGVEHLH